MASTSLIACDMAVDTDLYFIENIGQWDDFIEYRMDLPNGRMFLESNRFTYVWRDAEDMSTFHEMMHISGASDPLVMNYHAYQVDFEGSNEEVDIQSSCALDYYHNYYIGNDASKWASHVPLQKQLDYYDLYDNIDMHIYGFDNILKYDVVVKTGGNTADIQMVYSGVDDIYIADDKLYVVTSVNTITELAPYAYQQINGLQQEVACEFVVEGNVVSFHFPEGYDENYDLVIDPELAFSTYTGSVSDNWGYTATFDSESNHYGGGIIFGTEYPVTVGAFQEVFGGGNGQTFLTYPIDISITKFSADGTAQIFSTYLGGSANEIPHSLVVDSEDKLIVYGTSSSADFPVFDDAYDSTFNGGEYILFTNVLEYVDGCDIIVAKFNADGSELEGSTFVGGSLNDGLNGGRLSNVDPESVSDLQYNYGEHARGEVNIDEEDNIYVASCTFSSDFPTSADAAQSALTGGMEGVVFKLSSDLTSLEWSTYIGGTEDDGAYSVKVDENDRAYVCGSTLSPDFPATSGVLNEDAIGDIDGYVAIISDDGSEFEQATYIGTDAYDQCYFIEFNNDFEVFVIGQTLGEYPVQGDVFSADNGRLFIQKLDNDLTTSLLSTTIGAGKELLELVPTAFLVDQCERVYFSGWGGSVNTGGGIQNTLMTTMEDQVITSDAYQSTTDGSDFYIMILEQDLTDVLYATYIGGDGTNGEHVDGGTSRFDKNGAVYQSVCAGCGGTSIFPTTEGVWSEVNNNPTNCNLAAFKFTFDLTEVVSAFDFTSDCDNPNTVAFTNNSENAFDYEWDFGDGSDISTEENPTHTYEEAGEYEVTLIALDLDICGDTDTLTQSFNVFIAPDVSIEAQNFCITSEAAQLEVSPEGGEWSGDGVDVDGIFDPVGLAPAEYEVVYTVEADTCVYSASAIITVFDEPDTSFELLPEFCANDEIYELVPATTGGTFSGPGVNGNTFDPSAAEIEIGVAFEITYEISVDGCESNLSLTTIVYGIPDASFTPQTLCLGAEAVQLEAAIEGGEWSGDGVDEDGMFDPTGLDAGDYEITHSLTVDDCSSEYTDVVTILSGVSLEVEILECLPTGEFEISIAASGSTGGPYEYTIAAQEGTLNEDEPIIITLEGDGVSTYELTVTDDLGCSATEEIDALDCPSCFPDPGTMPPGPQIVCDGGTVEATTTDPNIDEGAELWYILHDSADNTAGEIFAINQTGTFDLSSIDNLEANTTYYISAVVAFPDDNGEPDFDDECTAIAPGTEVIMLEPIVLQLNGSCDWETTGEYTMTVAISGGLPAYDSSETYAISGYYSDPSFNINQTFTVVLPPTDGTLLEFYATDALECEGYVSYEIICYKTPIELLSFEGTAITEGNQLNWSTATESNSQYFEIQRSTDGTNFQALDRVEAANNSTQVLHYDFLDENVQSNAYYRLKAVDNDETFDYSNIILIERNTVATFELLPNPTAGNLQIQYQGNGDLLNLNIYDLSGQSILTQSLKIQADTNTYQLDVNALPIGIYFIQLQSGQNIYTQKLIKE